MGEGKYQLQSTLSQFHPPKGKGNNPNSSESQAKERIATMPEANRTFPLLHILPSQYNSSFHWAVTPNYQNIKTKAQFESTEQASDLGMEGMLELSD